MEKLLQMTDISKSYSGIAVLKKVSFDLFAGEVHVLLGENGAGKSTLIKILSGAEKASSGTIKIDGRKVEIRNPVDGLMQKIRVIYQELNLNDNLSVAENIFMGNEIRYAGFLVNWRETYKLVSALLGDVGLELDPRIPVGRLGIAQKQMIELCKSLIDKTKILVLDEPTATLTEREKDNLFKIIVRLKEEGMGIIYISHRLKDMFEIGSRVTVLRNGEPAGTLHVGDADYDEIIRLMVGKNVNIDKKQKIRTGTETILEVDRISDGNRLKSASFNLRKGEILGVAGLVGSGRTEMAKCLVGANKAVSGSIVFKDRYVKYRNPGEGARDGIVYVSEDRKAEGLIVSHSVADNALLPNLEKCLKYGMLNEKIQNEMVGRMVDDFKIKINNLNSEIRFLSGGNQQKISLARWISHGADVYVIDEPTRGIDIGARQQIYDIIDALVDSGAAVLMISSDITELLKMSDRILVLKDGRTVKICLNDDKLSQSEVLRHIIGGMDHYGPESDYQI